MSAFLLHLCLGVGSVSQELSTSGPLLALLFALSGVSFGHCCLFWGPTLWCSGLTPGSVLRDHFRQSQGSIWDAGIEPGSAVCKAKPYLPYYL